MKKPPPKPLPTTGKRPQPKGPQPKRPQPKRPQPAVPHQASGPARSPKPERAHESPPQVHSPPVVPLQQAASTQAGGYFLASGFRELRHNTVVRRVVLVAAVAAAIGLVYVAWQDSRGRSEVQSSGWSLTGKPPAQLPRAGSYVDSRILPTGDVRVEYWVRTRKPMKEITLVVPRGDGPGGAPKATDVDVAAELFEVSDGRVVGTSAVYPLDYPSRVVRLRYTLVGAVVRSPSVPGRALVRFTSADPVSMPEDGPRIIRIRAPEVLNVACRAPAPVADPKPCGSPVGTSWHVELQGADRNDEVSAQVNLSRG